MNGALGVMGADAVPGGGAVPGGDAVAAADPVGLDAAVDRLAATEYYLAAVAEQLEAALAGGDGAVVDGVVVDGVAGDGAAGDALRERHRQARSGVSAAHERYATTTAALRDYAVTLHAQREQVQRATVAYEDAVGAADAQAMDVAVRAYANAVQAVDEAAVIAIRRMEAGFASTHDSWWDRIAQMVGGVTHMLTGVARWAREFLDGVLEELHRQVERIETTVAVVLALVAVVAVIELPAMNAAWTADQLAQLWGLDDAQRLRLVVLGLSVAIPALGLYIASRLADEVHAPAPHVRELDAQMLSSTQTRAQATLNRLVPQDVADLLAMAGLVDQLGGAQRAVVDIARVEGADGHVGWIVALPSTQDWVITGDQGAPNDLDADLMLMLYPDVRTQYEKAVLDAMSQAGIAAGEPVVLTGWSLGGIMAGRLMEHHAGGYTYAGLVCAGSPIDGMNLGAQTPVVQVKHLRDPIHRADLIDVGAPSGHRVEVWDGPRSQGASPSVKSVNVIAHTHSAYLATLRDHLTFNAAHGVTDLSEPFRGVVLPADAPTTITHHQYTFHE